MGTKHWHRNLPITRIVIYSRNLVCDCSFRLRTWRPTTCLSSVLGRGALGSLYAKLAVDDQRSLCKELCRLSNVLQRHRCRELGRL